MEETTNLKLDRVVAELIDELVYEERQRFLLEEKCNVHVRELESLLTDLVRCIQSLCDYTHVLESEVFSVWCETVKKPQTATIAKQRSQMIKNIAVVSSVIGSDAERAVQSYSPLLGSLSTAHAHTAASGVDPDAGPVGSAGVSAESSFAQQDVRRLARTIMQHKEALTVPLLEVRNVLSRSARRVQQLGELTDVSARTPPRLAGDGGRSPSPPVKELQELRHQVEALGSLLRQQQEASQPRQETPAHAESPSRRMVPVAHDEDRDGTHGSLVKRDTARLLAYEKTVLVLNEEVTSLQRQLNAATERHAAEIARLQEARDADVRSYEIKMAECDTALCRLSLEMELLIKENAQLKMRLRGS